MYITVQQFLIYEAEERPYWGSISSHVTATLLWGVRASSTGSVASCYYVESADSLLHMPGDTKEEWKHLWLGFSKELRGSEHPALTTLLTAPPREGTASPSTNCTAEPSKGRGKHRIHEHRLAKVIILHYLLRGPELSGTPLTVCCAPHTAPLHSALPLFAC